MDNEIMELITDKFEQYCEEENYCKIKDYLKNFKQLANYNNGAFLEIIADKGNLDILKLFVENGADINIDHNYVLYTCMYHHYDDCVQYLLANGAKNYFP